MAATLTVIAPPAITAQPVKQDKQLGQSATFMVTATGTEPLTYQWRRNGQPLAEGGDISGSKTETLTISNIEVTDGGGYTVHVSNAAGSATSQSAALTLLLPDLVVESVMLIPDAALNQSDVREGDSYVVRATIVNQGNLAAEAGSDSSRETSAPSRRARRS